MDNLASEKRFKSLLDEAAADHAGLGQSIEEDATLGPCVGDDNPSAPTSLTTLGPCVGDDSPESDLSVCPKSS